VRQLCHDLAAPLDHRLPASQPLVASLKLLLPLSDGMNEAFGQLTALARLV
jgi:hypothetical protein